LCSIERTKTMFKYKTVCSILILWCMPAIADEAPQFTPARFADSEEPLQSLIEFSHSGKDIDVKIKCDTVITDEGKISRVVCYGPDRRKVSYKKAIYDVIKNVEFVPATVNGEAKTVILQCTVQFVRQEGVANISVYPNHGYNVKKYGDNYSGVQRYDWDIWSSRGCRRHNRRFFVSTEAIVGSDGKLLDYKLDKGEQRLGPCEEDLNKHVSSGSYIPAMMDDIPVQAKFVESHLNYLDPKATY